MKKTSSFLFVVSIVTLSLACNRSSVSEDDKEFDNTLSFQQNPYGNWQVGYSKDTSLNPASFMLSTFADTARPVPLWHPSIGAGGYYPYAGQNTDTTALLDVSGQWAARKGQMAMEGNNNGQFAIVRFIVPQDGSYKIRALFEGIHFGLSTTDVHVLHNEQSLFSDLIDGYGGDTAFHATTGNNPSSSFEDILQLKKADILTFAVGFGANKTFYNDTTGLLVSIERN